MPEPHPAPTPHSIAPLRHFAMQFTSTPRGARLARRLAARRLDAWGFPCRSDTADAVVLLVAELTANAVQHATVPGRDFHLTLALLPGAGRTCTLRVEVSDARADKRPQPPARPHPDPDSATGRGLLLVDHLATRWDITDRHPIGKTVRAELDVTTPPRPTGGSLWRGVAGSSTDAAS